MNCACMNCSDYNCPQRCMRWKEVDACGDCPPGSWVCRKEAKQEKVVIIQPVIKFQTPGERFSPRAYDPSRRGIG